MTKQKHAKRANSPVNKGKVTKEVTKAFLYSFIFLFLLSYMGNKKKCFVTRTVTQGGNR